MYKDLAKQNAGLKEVVLGRIRWFRKNPSDTRLDNHSLTKKMAGRWAFSITDDVRIVYEWTGTNTVRFLAVGPHKTVYTKSS